MNEKLPTMHRILFMLGLVIAGEAIFALPFHVARFFRPTVLEVFNLMATELGAVPKAGNRFLSLACRGPVPRCWSKSWPRTPWSMGQSNCPT